MTPTHAHCLRLLSIRRDSAGNLARRLMGLGLVPKDARGYDEVKAALADLQNAGKVSVSGNGKAHHWRVT